MKTGSSIGRPWVIVLYDGNVMLDWGNGLFQDIATGEFARLTEAQISHTIGAEELEYLRASGQIDGYDDRCVYFHGLPERPQSDEG